MGSIPEQEQYQHSENGNVEDLPRRAARNRVVAIDLFPDLAVKLRQATGYGPHVEVMQHLVYWFHDRKPKMRKRWSLYKTFDEWHDETGLSERQVKKGRETLRNLGVLRWWRGRHSHVWYEIDWIALERLLKSDTEGVSLKDPDQDDSKSDTKASGLNGSKSDTKASDTNTGDYVVTEEFPLQGAGSSLHDSPAAPTNEERNDPAGVTQPNYDIPAHQPIPEQERLKGKVGYERIEAIMLHPEEEVHRAARAGLDNKVSPSHLVSGLAAMMSKRLHDTGLYADEYQDDVGRALERLGRGGDGT